MQNKRLNFLLAPQLGAIQNIYFLKKIYQNKKYIVSKTRVVKTITKIAKNVFIE